MSARDVSVPLREAVRSVRVLRSWPSGVVTESVADPVMAAVGPRFQRRLPRKLALLYFSPAWTLKEKSSPNVSAKPPNATGPERFLVRGLLFEIASYPPVASKAISRVI